MLNIKYLKRLLYDEKERLRRLRKRHASYAELKVAIAYRAGRVEAYEELLKFASKEEGSK